MVKQVLQIEATTAEDLKKDILSGVDKAIEKVAMALQNPNEEKLLSREETANLLSISLVTLWDWTKKDIIPAYRIGYKVRYKKSEVLQALKKMNQFDEKK